MYTLTYINTSIYQIKQSVLIECKTLRLSLVFHNACLNDRIRNNSVKNCAKYTIFVPK